MLPPGAENEHLDKRSSKNAPAVGFDGEGIDLLSVWRFFLRRKVLIIFFTLSGCFLGMMTAAQIEPEYKAETRIVIDDTTGSALAEGAGVSLNNVTMRTELGLINSSELLEKLVSVLFAGDIISITKGEGLEQKEQKGTNPFLSGMLHFWSRQQEDLSIEHLAHRIKQHPLIQKILPDSWLALREQPQSEGPVLTAFERAQEFKRRKANELMRGLEISQVNRSHVVSIAYSTKHQSLAATVPNKLADLYIEEQLQRKKRAAGGASEFIGQRLAELEQELRQAELAVEEFVTNNLGIAPASAQKGNQEVLELTSLLVEVRASRKERQARLEHILGLKERGGNLESLNEFLQSPYMVELWSEQEKLRRDENELRTEYGNRHPAILQIAAERKKLKQRITKEIDSTIANIRNELHVSWQKEAAIQADIDRLINKSSEAGRSQVELRNLERKAAASRRIYEDYLNRQKDRREGQEAAAPHARVIARAVRPNAPDLQKRYRVAGISVLMSLSVALCIAFVRERFDMGVKSGKEIQGSLGLPYLGLTPMLKNRHMRPSIANYMLSKPHSAYSESVRSVYTTAGINRKRGTVQICSSVPREGKSTFAISMATMLALDGKSVILVDCDFRHPSVGPALNLEGENCLVSYMENLCSVNQAVFCDDDCLGFDVLPVLRYANHPSRYIASTRFQALLKNLKDQYEIVIIDSPPVLGVSDSQVLMEYADQILFVVKWNETKIDTLSDSVNMMTAYHHKVTGIALAQVDIEKQACYNYGGIDAYYRNYNYYYRN